MGIPPHEDPEQVAEAPSLEFLFEQALRQDKDALKHLFTLINTKHYKQITARLKGLRTGAGNPTVEDVFQDTVITLMEKLEAGELKELTEEDRKDILKYFQGLCNGRLKDVVRKRKSPVLQRHKAQIPETFADRGAKIPGEQRYTEYLSLIDYAASRLSPEHAAILRMYRDGVPYEEMARITGKKVETLRNLIVRLKDELQLVIVPRSDTAELHYEKSLNPPKRRLTRREIEAAVEKLPAINKDAFLFVHVEGNSVEQLAERIGDDDTHRAQGRLEDAYRILSQRLNDIFPDAYERALEK